MKARQILFIAAMGAVLFLTACQSQKKTKVYDFTTVAPEQLESDVAQLL